MDRNGPDVPDAGMGGANFEPHPAYEDLDDGVQLSISQKQFAWLPDVERSRFMASIGEPDTFPDA